MSKTRLRVIYAGAAVLLICCGVFAVHHHKKSSWIAQQVFTVSMSEMRQRTRNNILEAYKLIPEVQKENDRTAYSVIYYPETHTVLATVALDGMEDPQFYLSFEDSSIIKGWYSPDLVKYDITHVAFEELESQGFAYLDFVDGAKLGDTPYDPEVASDARLARFPIAMPPPRPYSWSNPAPSSSAQTSEARTTSDKANKNISSSSSSNPS